MFVQFQTMMMIMIRRFQEVFSPGNLSQQVHDIVARSRNEALRRPHFDLVVLLWRPGSLDSPRKQCCDVPEGGFLAIPMMSVKSRLVNGSFAVVNLLRRRFAFMM